MATWKAHLLAELLPEATEADVAALATDIQARGLITPILLFEGKVLDGRTRLRACELVGVEPRFDDYKGDDPIGAVATLNLPRRNLNESQRALLAARVRHRWTEMAASTANWQLANGDLAVMAAKIANVSPRSVYRAAKLLETGREEDVAAVFRGEVAVSKALRGTAKAGRATAKRSMSCDRLAVRLIEELRRVTAHARELGANRAVRVLAEDALLEAAKDLYAVADGSAYATEGA